MFQYKLKSQFITVLDSSSSPKPLQRWSKVVIGDGIIRRLNDKDTVDYVLEITASSIYHAQISCPKDPTMKLGVHLPVLVMLIKNVRKYFRLQIKVLDDTGAIRTFTGNNYQSTATVKPSQCTLPIRMDPGWNYMPLNLQKFTADAYGTRYVEMVNLTVYANCRIARIYFCNKVYGEEELPEEYKILPPRIKQRYLF